MNEAMTGCPEELLTLSIGPTLSETTPGTVSLWRHHCQSQPHTSRVAQPAPQLCRQVRLSTSGSLGLQSEPSSAPGCSTFQSGGHPHQPRRRVDTPHTPRFVESSATIRELATARTERDQAVALIEQRRCRCVTWVSRGKESHFLPSHSGCDASHRDDGLDQRAISQAPALRNDEASTQRHVAEVVRENRCHCTILTASPHQPFFSMTWALRIDKALNYGEDLSMEKKQRSSKVALSLAVISLVITPVLLFVEFSSLMLSEIFWVPIAVVALILPWMAFTWVKSGASRFLAGLVLLAWLAVQVWIGGTALGLWSLLG